MTTDPENPEPQNPEPEEPTAAEEGEGTRERLRARVAEVNARSRGERL